MALLLENGTGIDGANAFVTTAELGEYLTDRNVDPADYDTDQLEASIIIASSDFISTYYTFKGDLLNDDQGMSLPTNDVGITAKVKQATNNAAWLDLQGKLFVSADDIYANGSIKGTKKAVGTLVTEVEYQESEGYTSKYPTPTIDRLLQPYTLGGFAPSFSKRY